MSRFEYYRPKSLEEVWELKEKIQGARLIAGATDLMVRIKNRFILPEALISLRSIPALSGIEEAKGVRIGATTTITDLMASPVLRKKYPVLVAAAATLGSVQIRNVATIGGNLCNCSPCADTATPLLVLEARVRLQSPKGRRDIPIQEFFRGPGESCMDSNEVLTDIFLDPPGKNCVSVFLKKGRVKMDLAVASVAALLEMEGEKCVKARFAAGSVAPVPLRLTMVESLLEGSSITKESVAEATKLAMDSVYPISDVRASEEYRRCIIGVYVKRAIEKAAVWSKE